MTEKILLVDDDPNVLDSYKRQLRKKVNMHVALGGQNAINVIETNGPFAVIVSDMRMPGMDGSQLLSIVKERYPNTVRMVLTGNADLTTTIEAVNKGNIFRFLCKPCKPEMLVNAIMDGISQYRLIVAEQALLDKTLNCTISVLTDILGMVNPLAFSRTSIIRRHVKQIAQQLKLPNLWQYEMAGLLSQIGCVTLPSEIIKKVNSSLTITADEKQMFVSHPLVGSKLIEKIPRLEKIAYMIKGQQRPFKEYQSNGGTSKIDSVSLGSQILKVVHDFDLLLIQNIHPTNAIVVLRKRRGVYNPDILDALIKVENHTLSDQNYCIIKCNVGNLTKDMILMDNIVTKTGTLLIAKGTEVTEILIKRMQNYSRRVGIKEPFNVRIQSSAS